MGNTRIGTPWRRSVVLVGSIEKATVRCSIERVIIKLAPIESFILLPIYSQSSQVERWRKLLCGCCVVRQDTHDIKDWKIPMIRAMFTTFRLNEPARTDF
jgi:hypothetical protein